VEDNMRRRHSRALADINIANLVDVILVLLIIFMITAPMLQSGVDVSLPKAELTPKAEKDGLVITIDKSGKIYIAKYEVSLKDLASRLKAVANRQNTHQVYLKGDESINYGRIIEVVAEIKKAGLSDVGLVIEPIKSASQ
jgi:biopolymer transport protein TolR